MDPADFTPRWLAGLDGSLSIYCDPCRVIRVMPLRKLVETGREKQRIAAMVFRCRTCHQVGRRVFEWVDSRGEWRHDVESGETMPRPKNPGFYPPPDDRR